MRGKIKYLTLSAVFTALICVGAWIKIPFIIPVTLQFFFVNTAILSQKPKYAVLSIAVYIFMGLIGIPVFSSGGGITYVFTPSFGYLIGFLAAAFLSVFIKNKKHIYIQSFLNIFIIYLFGLFYFYLISHLYINTDISISKLLVTGFLIFIPSDLVSIFLSCAAVKYLRRLGFVQEI